MKLFLLLTVLSIGSFASAQHTGMSFQDTKEKNIKIEELEKKYRSAVTTPSSESVFKQEELQEAYTKLLKDWGKFLTKNNFKWEKKTKCFQRIYFNNDGTIDYFIFNFLGAPEEVPSPEKQKEFARLLNDFIKDYRFPLSATVKFAQCSPTTYVP